MIHTKAIVACCEFWYKSCVGISGEIEGVKGRFGAVGMTDEER